jgi:hypothetical protein
VTAAVGRSATARRGRAVAVVLRAPWTSQTWLATTHVMVGAPMGAVSSCLLALLIPFSAGIAVLPCSWLFTRWQRARFAAYLGVSLQLRPGHRPGDPWGRWL